MPRLPISGALSLASAGGRLLKRLTPSGHDLLVALLAGLALLAAQAWTDDRRDAEADRRENLRFVRELVANDKTNAVSLRGIDLRARDLSGLQLDRVSLPSADLSEATLRGINLAAADLNEINFASSDLYQANLSSASLNRANLAEANLQNADLSEANIVHADLTRADLEQTNLSNARLGSANLQGARLFNASLEGAELAYSDLSNAQLLSVTPSVTSDESVPPGDGPNLLHADLSGSTIDIDLRGARLENTKLYGADLSGARLTGDAGGYRPLVLADGDYFVGTEIPQPSGIVSVCYDTLTKWPAGFPTDRLPELQCDEMKD